MKSVCWLVAALVVLGNAAAVQAESRSVLVLLQREEKTTTVTIYSDEKKEQRSAVGVEEGAKVIAAMVGWGSTVGVFVVAEPGVARADRAKLSAAIDGNGWLELSYLGPEVPKFPGDYFGVPPLKKAAAKEAVDAAQAAWSKPVNRLQARLALVQKADVNGTPQLVPYLELRNAGDWAAPLQVRCGAAHVRFDLVDADGKVVRDGNSLPRSGPHAQPGTVSLPFDSSLRLGMYCSNWGVPANAPAMISTDSGAWILKAEECGKVYLRATIHADRATADPDALWHGTIEASTMVEWNAAASR